MDKETVVLIIIFIIVIGICGPAIYLGSKSKVIRSEVIKVTKPVPDLCALTEEDRQLICQTVSDNDADPFAYNCCKRCIQGEKTKFFYYRTNSTRQNCVCYG